MWRKGGENRVEVWSALNLTSHFKTCVKVTATHLTSVCNMHYITLIFINRINVDHWSRNLVQSFFTPIPKHTLFVWKSQLDFGKERRENTFITVEFGQLQGTSRHLRSGAFINIQWTTQAVLIFINLNIY